MSEHPETRHAKLLDETADRIRRQLGKDSARPAADLSKSLFSGALPEDLENETADNLFGLAAASWSFIRNRAADEPLVRAYNPDIEKDGWHSPHTVVEALNTNSPFLLDSTVAALNRLDLTIHLVLHPVVHVERDSEGRVTAVASSKDQGIDSPLESFIHVQVTRQLEAEGLRAIEAALRRVYADVRAAVEDWQLMRERVSELIQEFRAANVPGIPADELQEGLEFLEWLRDDQFTFLGARDYCLELRDAQALVHLEEDSGLGVLRHVSDESRKRHSRPISAEYQEYLCRSELFMITKANERSRVHRPVYMDYIGVRRFDANGNVVGERRFLGLLTSAAYSTRATRVPLLRRKVERVLEASGLTREGHDTKALINVLETFPRDELFQIPPDELLHTARGIMRLEHRQRIRLFLRRDRYGRFFSALVFIPRDVFSTNLRLAMEQILLNRLGGHSLEVATQFSEAPMVRAHFIIRVGESIEREPDVADIERDLADAARTWEDELQDRLVERFGEAQGARMHRQFANSMPPGYKSAHPPRVAVADIDHIGSLTETGDIALNLYRRVGAEPGEFSFKVYHRGDAIPLSRVLPVLENMGLVVVQEHPFSIEFEDGSDDISIHDFQMVARNDREIEISEMRERFESLFDSVWSGEFENDRYNGLVLDGLDGREISVLRAYAKYLRQIKAPFSLSYMQQTLSNNPELTRLLVQQFHALHDPDATGNPNARSAGIRHRIEVELEAVESADEDRILRRFVNLIDATLRTNFYQRNGDGSSRPSIALKFDSAAVADLPNPRPWREIFVYSPRFEAVHLRGGRVARGGIRWSDRREDFRTEILGLVKAQMVKNSVIVPVGAKGGFVLKRPQVDAARVREEGVQCYRLFMSALLDITDNLVDGKARSPDRVLRHDGEDPYLVVAADKGTAAFSDIANEVASEYGHWLGDAFASGGSAGYDHKAMGITARGAWEAIKRHFREIGTDIQTEPFTVVGIGDMAGDVFGNGMLLSRQIRLIGAFNHMHIFLDPEPDASSSYEERSRLFNLPRSTWDDYDRSLISPGGGIFNRKAKSIPLTPEIRDRLGIAGEQIRPNDLIRAMLVSEVDLLWNGGIGTYVKSRTETHAEVDDRTNDALRVNGDELRCKVLGEGGNLGCTQAGRIEFAQHGGRINTDAIDNSAGVDCSDHEVNIKILLNGIVADGDMTRKQRDERLDNMTDEVARMVLRNNYVQTQCLTTVDSISPGMFGEQIRFLRALESRKLLDRNVEGLPDDEELMERRSAGRTFTRPELAVLLAYAKMNLYAQLLDSDFPDDPYLSKDLLEYFPGPLREEFPHRISQHQLRREIIATVTANDIIDRAGITFVHRHTEHSGILPEAVVRAYIQVREVFGLRYIVAAIQTTDNELATELQAALHARVLFFANRATAWFLRHVPPGVPAADVIRDFRPCVESLANSLESILDADSLAEMKQEDEGLVSAGVPADLAASIARLGPLAAACDVVQEAQETELDANSVATVFFETGRRFACAWIRSQARNLPQVEHWDMLAAEAIAEDSYAHQRALTARVLEASSEHPGIQAIESWEGANKDSLSRFRVVLGELKSASSLNLSMLNVVNRSLRVLAEAT